MKSIRILRRLPTTRAISPFASHHSNTFRRTTISTHLPRAYSTTTPPPPPSPTPTPTPTRTQAPLLTTLRADLKSLMIAKQQPQLTILRSILSDITTASKTSSSSSSSSTPNDLSILRILRKRAADSAKNAKTFTDEGRDDLAAREMAEEQMCMNYAGMVAVVSDEEIKAAVEGVLGAMRRDEGQVRKGDVAKRLFGPGGVLEGKPVEKAKVVEIVDQALGSAA